MPSDADTVQAQARLLHAYFLGLQLMVSTRKGPTVMGDWMFRLFRRQHHAKFLSSFEKLGLTGLPHALACARYHVLSNGVGGVAVEYAEEGPRKAWVRFRYPRWMYDGVAICGVPVEVSRGFLRGWYAHNGVSLQNPRLGFVCVSEDMTGEFGLCGYFREFDHDLDAEHLLQFRPGEMPPAFDPAAQPKLPEAQWTAERRGRAARNYAMEYVRNGLAELAAVIGTEETHGLANLTGRLIGMQFRREIALTLGVDDGGVGPALEYLRLMAAGLDAHLEVINRDGDRFVDLSISEPRLVRGIEASERSVLLEAWRALCAGALRAQRQVLDLQDLEQAPMPKDACCLWRIAPLGRD